jgi:hypothetical protein
MVKGDLMLFLEKVFYTAYYEWVRVRSAYIMVLRYRPDCDRAEMGKQYWIGDHAPLPEIDSTVQRP